jgi:hypothetical protein
VLWSYYLEEIESCRKNKSIPCVSETKTDFKLCKDLILKISSSRVDANNFDEAELMQMFQRRLYAKRWPLLFFQTFIMRTNSQKVGNPVGA